MPAAFRWRMLRLIGGATLVALLAACASGGGQRSAPSRAASPGPAPAWERDGPGLSPPPDIAAVPDAVPQVEPFRSGTLRPYVVLGRHYVPITEDVPHVERGLASWYGRKFHGRPTAIGEPYDMYAMTAAHPTLPLPSYVRVRNPANQREVLVRINDRGPFHPGRIIDLSYTAAWKLDLLRGVAPVEIERITLREIRDGSWQRAAPPGLIAVAAGGADATPAAPVLDVAVAPPVSKAATAARVQSSFEEPAQGFWVQLGAFRVRDGAEVFQRRVVDEAGWIAPHLQVRNDVGLHRLQAGPFADREQAVAVAERLRESLQLVPVIVERR